MLSEGGAKSSGLTPFKIKGYGGWTAETIRLDLFSFRQGIGFFNEHATYGANEVSEHKSLCELNPPPLSMLTIESYESGGGSNSDL